MAKVLVNLQDLVVDDCSESEQIIMTINEEEEEDRYHCVPLTAAYRSSLQILAILMHS